MLRILYILVSGLLFVGGSAVAAADQRSGDLTGFVPHPQTGADYVPYMAAIPAGKGPYSLIVALHGINGNERQLVGPIKRSVQEAGFADRYAILGLKSLGAGWEDVDHERIRAAIAWACATWPIDQRRIHGWGYSHGAFRLGVFGHQAQTLFGGVVLLSGGVSPVSSADSAKPVLSWYIIHGDADATVGVDRGRSAVAVLSAAGYPFVYHEIRGEGHGTAGSAAAAPYRLDAVRWLDRLRCEASLPGEEAQKFLAATKAKLDEGKRVTPSQVLPGLMDIGGASGRDLLLPLLADSSASVHGLAAKVASAFPSDAALITALQDLVINGKGTAREAALLALADAANWHEAGAAQAIAGILADTSADRKLRQAAIAALGRSVPLHLPCGNPDPLVFAPLIAALMDEDIQIRAAAITALVGGSPDTKSEGPTGGFGYAPQASAGERQAAQTRWTAWMQQR